MATKKRSDEGAAKKTAKKTAKATGEAARPARRPAAKTAQKPRIHASHAEGKPAARRARTAGGGALTPAPKSKSTGARKTPLAGPKRPPGAKRSVAPPPAPEPSSASRELALALAAAGIDKKAIGIEILDVTGKVDYADYLVVMTGRSDRHVNAIATGIEDAMRKRKMAPLSMEGLTGATWVLIDFGDVVVHVFQEDARAVYDIEGLWIDASRIPVPDADKAEGAVNKAGD
ncbi:MAG: ribosome silencing factor [Minicystis sp.]